MVLGHPECSGILEKATVLVVKVHGFAGEKMEGVDSRCLEVHLDLLFAVALFENIPYDPRAYF